MATTKALKFKHIPLKRDRLASLSSSKKTKTKKTVEVPADFAKATTVKEELLPVQPIESTEIMKDQELSSTSKTVTTSEEEQIVPEAESRTESSEANVKGGTILSSQNGLKTHSEEVKETSGKGLQITSGKEIVKEPAVNKGEIGPETNRETTTDTAKASADEMVEKEADLKEIDLDKKGKGNKAHFPSISRIITDKWFLFGLVCGVLIIGIVILLHTIYANLQEKQDLQRQRQKIQQQISYWQKQVQSYQGYRDGYFQLAVLEYQLGNVQASQTYLNKVDSLDPNFDEAHKLEALLQK